MPLSTSPRPLPSSDMSEVSRPQEEQKVFPSTELPIRTQVSPLSTPPQSYEQMMPMTTASRALGPSERSHTQQVPLIFDSEAMQWSAQGHFPHNSLVRDAFCTPELLSSNTGCTEYAQHAFIGVSCNANNTLKYPLNYTSPRSFQDIAFRSGPSDMAASYPPAAYFHSPPQMYSTPSLPDNSTPELTRLSEDWDLHYGTHIQHEDYHDYNSPYSDMSRASTPYSTGHEDEPIDKEQPYAQLIFRALLNAPEHTMVLRDIYDWFRRYTDKATHSETKGWQNSIRHNLSMNGAFEKVESPSDAATKGFMWRLTQAALREGVKSTTRYRSKAPNKRSHRTQPLPQRQASGAKGGHAARRSANLRRSQRAREAGLYPRPTPSSDPYFNNGYNSEWEECAPSSVYTAGSESPYPMSLSYDTPRDNAFSPMLGLATHLVSPPRSYASTPISPTTSLQGFMGADAAYVLEQAPGEPLFGGSPTPSAEEPITPLDGCRAWEDVPMGLDVYGELGPFEGSI